MLNKVETLIKQAEDRKSFFKRISSFLVPMDPRYKAIEKAYDFAKDAFRDKERGGGGRYFEHLRAVALIIIDYLRVRDPVIIIAALLHDIVEDIPSWTIERVRIEFGDEVALLVNYLSKPSLKDELSQEESTSIYHSRFRNAPREFFFIKLSDRLHNLLTMWNMSMEHKEKKIEETRKYYLPYAEKHIILIHEIEAAIKRLESNQK
jgi:(p)ppGpp synthase/HD superfamily hydrolase